MASYGLFTISWVNARQAFAFFWKPAPGNHSGTYLTTAHPFDQNETQKWCVAMELTSRYEVDEEGTGSPRLAEGSDGLLHHGHVAIVLLLDVDAVDGLEDDSAESTRD